MLVLGRNTGQSLTIGPDITVKVTGKVWGGIEVQVTRPPNKEWTVWSGVLKSDERLDIGPGIWIEYAGHRYNRPRIGIEAPDDVPINRDDAKCRDSSNSLGRSGIEARERGSE